MQLTAEIRQLYEDARQKRIVNTPDPLDIFIAAVALHEYVRLSINHGLYTYHKLRRSNEKSLKRGLYLTRVRYRTSCVYCHASVVEGDTAYLFKKDAYYYMAFCVNEDACLWRRVAADYDAAFRLKMRGLAERCDDVYEALEEFTG